MENEFVPHQQSLELKDLGFDKPCFGYYVKGDEYENWTFYREGGTFFASDFPEHILAPTFSQAFRFFRKKYKLDSSIGSFCLEEFTPCIKNNRSEILYPISNVLSNGKRNTWEYDTYEEAELACLIQLIKIVKDEK